ncbi:hypothetical protein M407DRAFT_9773 [Tulasnella calospora MUT 4182]|uniref:Transcription factor domain-containing protein n=1 Tax=Tulasnella calospora MUT 4182 TaxID=1051891 RepID=A0A0C3Q2N3_9AGAM|nr:hypothetical protein M407DRAFT_9773 [Tulasnella calospora MUT 4182]
MALIVPPKKTSLIVPPPAAELRELLQAANAKLACCTCGAAATSPTNTLEPEAFSALTSCGSQHSESAGTPDLAREHPHVVADSHREETVAETSVPHNVFSSPSDAVFLLPNSSRNIESFPTPSISTFNSSSFLADGIGLATLEIFPSAWPPALPPPVVLYHLVETFFSSVPLASRLIHKPTFMVNLQQLPTSPDFPHTALLHAICGLASLYSPIIADPKVGMARANAAEGFFGPSTTEPLGPGANEGKSRFPKSVYDLKGAWDEAFGVAHIRLASINLRISVREGDRLLQMLQAAIICMWWTYSMGMTMGVYTWINAVTKLVGPLGRSVNSYGYYFDSQHLPHV